MEGEMCGRLNSPTCRSLRNLEMSAETDTRLRIAGSLVAPDFRSYSCNKGRASRTQQFGPVPSGEAEAARLPHQRTGCVEFQQTVCHPPHQKKARIAITAQKP